MAASAPQKAATEGRRELILEATLGVIGAGGVDAVTHRRVAEEAGVALGSIAYYFDSRDDLVRQAFRFYMEGVSISAAEIEEALRGGGVAELVRGLVALSERDLDGPELVHAEYEMLVYAGRDPELAREVTRWQKTLDARLAESLEELGVPKPLEGARSVRGALRGFELERLINPGVGGRELRRRLETVIAGLLHGPRGD